VDNCANQEKKKLQFSNTKAGLEYLPQQRVYPSVGNERPGKTEEITPRDTDKKTITQSLKREQGGGV